jgi:hypothetical protein
MSQKRKDSTLTFWFAFITIAFFLGWDFYYNNPDMYRDLKQTVDLQMPERGEVKMQLDWLPCASDSDCVTVDTKCTNCCGYQGINISSLQTFTATKEKQCRGWQGGVCECYNPKTKPVCVRGSCSVTIEDQKRDNESPGTPQTRPKPVEP